MKIKFKAIMSWVLALVFMGICFIESWKILRYISVDDSGSCTRITMHEFYEQDNIDVLFMGASHCYRGFDTDITDELLGCNTFNLGSSSQTIDVTYLLMQEAINNYDIEHIYVDLSYNMSTVTMEDQSLLIDTYIITDYMKPSLRKTLFLLKKSSSDNYVNTFLVARRNWENIFDLKHLEKVISCKQTPDYTNFRYVDDGVDRYAGKGFVESDSQITDGSFKDSFEKEDFSINKVNEAWMDIVKKMINYCDTHNVELTLISVPISSYRLSCYGDYDAYIELIEQIIFETGVEVAYIDFNLLREEYWADTSVYFKDYSHLNTIGAKEFSKLFCQYVNNEISYYELFYENISEKYESMRAVFYGIEYREPSEGDEYLSCHLVMNHPTEATSKITLVSENQDELLIKDWSKELDFQIPIDFVGHCNIEVIYNSDAESKTHYTIKF